MRPHRGAALLVALLLIYIMVLFGRKVCRETDFSAESFVKCNKIHLLLGNGFPRQGIYQFNDGIDLYSVIKLTMSDRVGFSSWRLPPNRSLRPGESLFLVVEDSENIKVNASWMPASQRLACGILLHPDRMNVRDWQVLPGIGPRLAEKIEENRQKNGEFGSLEGLRRVPGVGKKTVQGLRTFFSAS